MTRLLSPFPLAFLLIAACDTTVGKVDNGDTADADADTDADTDTDTDTDTDADTDTGPNGAALFQSNCASCHGQDGTGTYSGPDITGEVGRLTADEIVGIILEGKGAMPAVAVTEPEAYAIADWVQNRL